MVGLLVDQGLPEAAIELENYWNDLLAFSDWELYCAYPIRQFAHQGLAKCFCQICDEHSNVIPLKTDMDIPAGHGRCVAVLQQQSMALNSEIAERKQIENALRQQQETLEETIRQRTQELTLAKEKAEAANHAKDLFLANISHELRTPLNAVLGYSQILGRDKNLNHRQRSGLWAIQSSGEHLLMMINDVLDLAKIDAGKIDLELTAVRLDNFLHVIADIIAVKAQQKSLKLQLEFADDLPSGISIDEKRLRQILLNLLSNAVKFTDRGSVVFSVRHTDLADNKVTLHFSVKDSGIGIDPTQQERIFLPFEQIDSYRRSNIGTGLGLAISRQLAEKMNSVLQVSSTQDTGSEFYFDLVAEKVDIRQAHHKKPAHITGYQGATRKVLLVDDVPANLMLLQDILNPLGFETISTDSGLEALKIAQESPPDLVICDLVMPKMTGIELSQAMANDDALCSTPIIITSASANYIDQSECIAAGVSAVLAKPLDEEQLLNQLATELKLEWIGPTAPHASLVFDAAMSQDIMDNELTHFPPKADMQTLQHLAFMGDVIKLHKELARITQKDANYQSFTQKIDYLAKQYKTKDIVALLTRYLT